MTGHYRSILREKTGRPPVTSDRPKKTGAAPYVTGSKNRPTVDFASFTDARMIGDLGDPGAV